MARGPHAHLVPGSAGTTRASRPVMLHRTLLVTAAAVALAGCESLVSPSTITYVVIGSAQRATVVYNTPHGSSQATNVALPWAFAFGAEPKDYLYVSAQVVRGDGEVTVTIRKGASNWRSATATGLASVATASGPLQ
jgi:hypothetical protein